MTLPAPSGSRHGSHSPATASEAESSGPRASCVVELGPSRLWLLPEKAALLEDPRWLIVADAHVDKADALRRRGLPLPLAHTQDDVASLKALLERHRPRVLLFLGDLLHAPLPAGSPPPQWAIELGDFARSVGATCAALPGNHDRAALQTLGRAGWEIGGSVLCVGGIGFCHQPGEDSKILSGTSPGSSWPRVCGHLHPAVTLRGRAHLKVTLPCFWLMASRGCLCLPAFGSFTGSTRITPGREDRVWATDSFAVRPVPISCFLRGRPGRFYEHSGSC